jgi:hypothetical protein
VTSRSNTSGPRETSRMALGAAVLAALFFPTFTAWCYIQGWRWGVPFSFVGITLFLVFSLLMAVLILAVMVLVRLIAGASKVGLVVALLVVCLLAFMLVLLGFFWLLEVRWYGGPLLWDLVFSPSVRSVWIYALPLVAGVAYAGLVSAVFRAREKKG